MFGVTCKIEDTTAAVKAASDRATLTSLSRIGFAVRQEIVALIEHSPDPAAPGKPVHTRRGLANVAMRYATDRIAKNVVIGPRFSKVGRSMEPHEHGGTYKGVRYPARPTAAAGLAAVAPRIGPMFRQS